MKHKDTAASQKVDISNTDWEPDGMFSLRKGAIWDQKSQVYYDYQQSLKGFLSL